MYIKEVISDKYLFLTYVHLIGIKEVIDSKFVQCGELQNSDGELANKVFKLYFNVTLSLY